jgi:hypothetical protein
VHLYNGRSSHGDEIMFWDQSQNQLHKIVKIHGLSHQDHNRRSLNFQYFR